MPHKIDAIRHDILTAIDEIQGFVTGRSLSELLTDRAFQLVLEREFEILGEALYRVRNIAPEALDRICPCLRGVRFLLRPHLRRGEENRLEGRLPCHLVHPEVQPAVGCFFR